LIIKNKRKIPEEKNMPVDMKERIADATRKLIMNILAGGVQA